MLRDIHSFIRRLSVVALALALLILMVTLAFIPIPFSSAAETVLIFAAISSAASIWTTLFAEILLSKSVPANARLIKEAVFVGLLGMAASFGCMFDALLKLVKFISST
ncbi:hypothetical protein [Caballeronia sp. BCC1704]|uniref:hypothetical protein n=1 Tax=Caballeronia sp. BCC1704 TaxID=2676300 RepID=UPI00158E84FF|nr:hypothetical protein [Caballeronia sp. BCC1704]